MDIHFGPIEFVLIGVIIMCVIGVLFSTRRKRLDSIKADEVGHGQHGTDRWMTIDEAKELYTVVKFPERFCDMSAEIKPGRLIYYDAKKREAIVDQTTSHSTIQAPTNTGKTTEVSVPNIIYNLMAGANMIIPCIKKELLELTWDQAGDAGYNRYVIDFEDPSNSIGFDFFYDIDEELELYEKTKDLRHKAAAETAAYKLANDIVTSRERSENENKFFMEASLGLIQSVVLLVCMFGEKSQKHFSSVRKVLQEIAGLQDTSKKKQKDPKICQLLKGMPDDFGPKKHIGSAFAASNETEDNIYSSVLGDLRAMNDTMAEQIISMNGKKECFDYHRLVDEKCVLYIVCPETKDEFYLFFKLIIKKLTTQLSNYANKYCPNQKLPRQVRIPWDEFGLSPKIDQIDNELAIDRSKNIFFDLYFQSDNQLKAKYGEDIMKVIEQNCATNYILGVAAKDSEGAEKISKSLGTTTIRSGSVSTNYDGPGGKISNSLTEQMIERPLLTPGEVLRMDNERKRLILHQSQYPLMVRLTPYYSEDWPFPPKRIEMQEISDPKRKYYDVDYIDFHKMQEKLDKFRVGGEEKRTSKIETTIISADGEESISAKNPVDVVKMELFSLFKDEKVIQMVDERNWNQIREMGREKGVSRIMISKILQKMKEE